jgi:hypothetical protein
MKIKIFFIILIFLVLTACNSGSANNSDSTPVVRNGKLHVLLDGVPTCENTLYVKVYLHVVGQNVNDYSFTSRNAINQGFWDDKVPLNESLTLTVDPVNFVCNGQTYTYKNPENNIFTLTDANPTITFDLPAVLLDSQNTDFHFALPNENSDSSKWDIGKFYK